MTSDCMDDRTDSVSGRSGALGAESMEKDKAVGVDNASAVGSTEVYLRAAYINAAEEVATRAMVAFPFLLANKETRNLASGLLRAVRSYEAAADAWGAE